MPSIKNLQKNCAHCSANLERKRINGRLEDFSVFQRRQYCDQKCMGLAMMKADPTRKSYAKRARKLELKSCCEKCGTTESLSIHHDDLNWRNNEPSNLKTLCASCHTSLHHSRGEIKPAQPKPPCMHCGRESYRSGICNTCRTQIRRNGEPSPSTTKRRKSSKRV